jgi:flagellar motor switch protein FliG
MSPEEVANLLDEFFFLAIKYCMISENGEGYDRLEKNFIHPSLTSEQTLKRLRSNTTEELSQISNQLGEIRGKLIEEAPPK